jgi:hypothetical protein
MTSDPLKHRELHAFVFLGQVTFMDLLINPAKPEDF